MSASLSTLLREKARLAELDLPHVLLGGSDTRIARAENDALRRGGALIVLVTSDALGQAEVQGALTRADIAAVAIDGAELASDAGHELRPSYALLPARLAAFSAASRFALARPVTADVRRQAQVRLGLADATVLEGAVVDPAVRLESRAVRGERRNATLIELLPSLPQRGVILCATPHEVDGVCAVLGKESGSVYRVHAAMPHADRRSMSERFDADMGRALLVTTSAFGPDVGIPGLGESATNEPRAGFGADLVPRGLGFVLHHHAPASLEQYVRELACLGPSTPDALSLVFYDSSHRSMNQAILEQLRLPSQKLEAFARVLEATLGGNRPLKAEALALQTGVSRRTSERLLALLLDAGLLRRDAAGIAIENTPAERGPRLEALARALHGLQRDDATRLAAVERYAESSECKRRVLGHYFGRRLESNCGHCSNCRPHADTQRQANAR